MIALPYVTFLIGVVIGVLGGMLCAWAAGWRPLHHRMGGRRRE